jgi:predicted CopG family antitoxin
MNNVSYSREVIDLGLLEKLKEITTKGYITNEIIIENITSLYKNLVLNNLENIEKFCKRGIVINLFFCLENYWDKTPPEKNYSGSSSAPIATQPHLAKEENQNLTSLSAALQIVLNCIACLDSLTISDKAIAYLGETKFSGLILETLNKKQNEIDIIKTALHCLGSYLYKEIGNNLKTIDFENLIKILIFMQKKHYSNSDILIKINQQKKSFT